MHLSLMSPLISQQNSKNILVLSQGIMQSEEARSDFNGRLRGGINKTRRYETRILKIARFLDCVHSPVI
jgi:hypothetical protein